MKLLISVVNYYSRDPQAKLLLIVEVKTFHTSQGFFQLVFGNFLIGACLQMEFDFWAVI